MAFPTIPLCAECAETLPPRKPGPGKRRVYCSDRCRKRAERRRKAPLPAATDLQPAALEPYVDPDGTPPPRPPDRVAPPDEQLVVALLELRMTAAMVRQLSRDLRPQLSWRAETLAREMVDLVDRYFPVPAE